MNKRHALLWRLLRPPVSIFLKLKFGYKATVAKHLPDHYIVVSNHVTDYDPLFVAMSFPRQMYFVASEHISRWGKLYSLLRWALEPILRPKGAVGAATVKTIFRKLREGGNVALFAEGVRSWDGVTSPIHPSTVSLIRAARCGLVTYRIEGGYFASPMWSSSKATRKGQVRGAPVGIYTKEQLAAMSDEELARLLQTDLHEDAYGRQQQSPVRFRGKSLAQGLEYFLFVCPSCGAHASFCSHDDTVRCTCCSLQFTYDEYGYLHGAPFDTVRDFSRWQRERVDEDVVKESVYTAAAASLSTVSKGQATRVDEGPLSLSPTTLTCGSTAFALDRIPDMAMHGKHALVFSYQNEYYELIPDQSTNAIRFLLYFQSYQKQATKKIRS